MATLSVGQRVVMHLYRFRTTNKADIYNMPWDITQDGIAAALRISRAHASIELKKLREAEKVDEILAHIKNGKVKRKVYLLNELGLDDVPGIKDFATKEKIDIDSLLDLKRQDPQILLDDLSKENRFALGCACAFEVPVPIKELPETRDFTIPSDVNGNSVISEQLRGNILKIATPEEKKEWHGYAANYWFDRKIGKIGDYEVCIHELLYHYIESGRNRDACKLISGEMYYFINSIDDGLHDMIQNINVIDQYAVNVLTVMIETRFEYNEMDQAVKLIKRMHGYNADIADTYLSYVEFKNGNIERAKELLTNVKDYPMARIYYARILRHEKKYDEAKEYLLAKADVMDTEFSNYGAEKFMELARIDAAEGKSSDAYHRLCKVNETVNNPVFNKKLNALKRELKLKL